MTPDERKLRQMYRKGTVGHRGNKFIRRTVRPDWAAWFCDLVAALGGTAVKTNDCIIATLPPEVVEVITAPKMLDNARPRVPVSQKRVSWGSRFDPDVMKLLEALSERTGKAKNIIVEQAIREMAERENEITRNEQRNIS